MFNKKTLSKTFLVKREMPIIFFVACLLLCIIILVSFFPMTRRVKDDDYIKGLENRIAVLEKKNEANITASIDSNQAGINSNQLKSFNDAYQKLNATLTLLSGRIDGLQEQIKQMNIVKEKNDVLKEVKNGKKTGQTENQKKKLNGSNRFIYHVVGASDTFYSISRRNNITLKKLKEMNHFTENATLYPGQKIVVGP
jgi:LysM repeat protein